MSVTSIVGNPGECIAICPCCLGRVVVPAQAGRPPVLVHGTDRLSGEACPREGDAIATAVLWDRDSPEARQATVHDFPEHFGYRGPGTTRTV